MNNSKIDFYFDYLSPFSFFLYLKLKKSQIIDRVSFRPVVLGKILNHWGQKGPAEIAPKRDFLFKVCLRYSANHNVNFNVPRQHPFNSLYALRLSTLSVSCQDNIQQKRLIDILWSACWQESHDMGNPDMIEKLLSDKGLPGPELMELAFSRQTKQEVSQNVSDAIANGVFGVPSLVVKKAGKSENELFWGNDSFDDFVRYYEDRDLLNQERYQKIKMNTTMGAGQKLDIK